MRRNDLHGLLIIDACIENATSRSKFYYFEGGGWPAFSMICSEHAGWATSIALSGFYDGVDIHIVTAEADCSRSLSCNRRRQEEHVASLPWGDCKVATPPSA
jgi:hypothetical protein